MFGGDSILVYRISKNDFSINTYHKSKTCGDFKIISKNKSNYTIQFVKSGYIKNTKLSKIKSGIVNDPTYPKIYGVGYRGEMYESIRNKYGSEFTRCMYDRWRNMLSRCYDRSHKNFNIYGGSGVTVSEDWHNFSNFIIDAINLEGYNKNDFLSGKITLDKDKLQQGVKKSDMVYSKYTCCWLSIEEQNSLIDFSKAHEKEMIKFEWRNGNNHGIYKGVKKFARENNLSYYSIIKCLNNENKSYNNYTFKYIK